ncbi:hypothetical protein SAMN02745108_00164 [Fibrobacter intestinalis]|uniref:Uncharacterized protein n=1 Tax=Fibrobacter intestinalis TaxID=28122 RepID=A0A1T4JWK2_9BACT|nr:hypothetical protein BGW94_1334 [Fibrobacter sp. NR9]SJZ34566.1 hypothetical protein SAMN02745108_00164 [Fibrobacter intestinalis]
MVNGCCIRYGSRLDKRETQKMPALGRALVFKTKSYSEILETAFQNFHFASRIFCRRESSADFL